MSEILVDLDTCVGQGEIALERKQEVLELYRMSNKRHLGEGKKNVNALV